MKDLYKIAYEARDADSKRFWTMFGLMATVNGGLLAFIGTHICNRQFAILFGILGIAVCILWFNMQIRLRWSSQLSRIAIIFLLQIKSGFIYVNISVFIKRLKN